MPIYEYRCEGCGHTLDALQKLADEPLADCPECEASSLKRLMSAPSFRLKGAGWYETDFKSGEENKRNLAEHPEPKSKEEKKGKDEKKAKDDKKSADDKKSSKDSSGEKTPAKSKDTGSEAA